MVCRLLGMPKKKKKKEMNIGAGNIHLYKIAISWAINKHDGYEFQLSSTKKCRRYVV